MSSIVELAITPKSKDLGDNFVIRRSLPDARKKMVGPFIFWDHMGPVKIKPGKGMFVRSHPHIGLATITYLFSGQILHRDSLGNEQYIKPGEVNWMTAGSGITHSERSEYEGDEENAPTLEGIQLWLALPKESEEVDASFSHHKEIDLPLIEKGRSQLRLVAGEFLDKKSPVPVYSSLFYLNGKTSSGDTLTYKLQDNHEAAVYLIKGKIKVETETYNPGQLVIFKKESKVEFKACEDCEYMIFGGEIFPEGRNIFWNFVSSSKERIEKAKNDWRQGKFAKTINETAFIPLPEE